MKTLRVWWPRTPKPGNLGDVLTPHIFDALHINARWSPQSSADVLATGSIVRFAKRGQIVFGSGAMWKDDSPSPAARYLAVRGPLTRRAVLRVGGECPEVYGDPALLLPYFAEPEVRKVHDVGFVPHYRDHEAVRRMHPTERVIAVLRDNPMQVVREIRSCRAIVSSSLHGIIVAHAFGIPAAWVRWSNQLTGDDTKFLDYGASVGVEMVPYRSIGDSRPVLGTYDMAPLLDAAKGL